MHALQKNRILKGSGLQPARVMAFGTATQVADKTPTKVAAKKSDQATRISRHRPCAGRLRQKRGLSKAAFARNLGVSAPTISNWEAVKACPAALHQLGEAATHARRSAVNAQNNSQQQINPHSPSTINVAAATLIVDGG
jgi:DNA-binding transcriptional regulator YiaG